MQKMHEETGCVNLPLVLIVFQINAVLELVFVFLFVY